MLLTDRNFNTSFYDPAESYTVHGEDADHLSYSMCFIHNSNKEDRPDQFDEYLTQAISKKEYLVHKLFTEERTTETAVH